MTSKFLPTTPDQPGSPEIVAAEQELARVQAVCEAWDKTPEAAAWRLACKRDRERRERRERFWTIVVLTVVLGLPFGLFLYAGVTTVLEGLGILS